MAPYIQYTKSNRKHAQKRTHKENDLRQKKTRRKGTKKKRRKEKIVKGEELMKRRVRDST